MASTPLIRARVAAAQLSRMAEGNLSVGIASPGPDFVSDLPSPSIELNQAIHEAVQTTLRLANSATAQIAEAGIFPANYSPQWGALDQAERALGRAQTIFLDEMLKYEDKATQKIHKAIRTKLQSTLSMRAMSQVVRAVGRIQITPSAVNEFRGGIEDLKTSIWECVIPDW